MIFSRRPSRTGPARRAVWITCVVTCLAVLCWPALAARGPRHPARPPLIVVRALGPMPSQHLRATCRTLLEAYPVRCEVRSGRPLWEVESAWSAERSQLDARAVIEAVFDQRPIDDAVVEVNLTAADIFEGGKPFVFGLASLTDRVAIVSTHRIAHATRFEARLAKLARHEVGHTLGLHHHNDPHCVMRQDPTVASLDRAPTGLCPACHAALVRESAEVGIPGQGFVDRARGHLVRGREDAARETLVRALWSGQHDPDVLDAFARAFLDAGQIDEAIGVLAFVLRHHPRRARSHANLGLAYQLRGEAGDLTRAIAQFQEALRLEPQWIVVRAHLASLGATSSAQGPGR